MVLTEFLNVATSGDDDQLYVDSDNKGVGGFKDIAMDESGGDDVPGGDIDDEEINDFKDCNELASVDKVATDGLDDKPSELKEEGKVENINISNNNEEFNGANVPVSEAQKNPSEDSKSWAEQIGGAATAMSQVNTAWKETMDNVRGVYPGINAPPPSSADQLNASADASPANQSAPPGPCQPEAAATQAPPSSAVAPATLAPPSSAVVAATQSPPAATESAPPGPGQLEAASTQAPPSSAVAAATQSAPCSGRLKTGEDGATNGAPISVQSKTNRRQTSPTSLSEVKRDSRNGDQRGGGLKRTATFDPEEDAANLYNAFKGKGCDTARIVNILANRCPGHRIEIQQKYRDIYKEELIDRLSAELSRFGKGNIKETLGLDFTLKSTSSLGSTFSSDIKRALTLWMLGEAERDATIVWNGLTLLSKDITGVTEVICSRTPTQLQNLQRAYFTSFQSQLTDDIASFTSLVSGSHKELLLACLKNDRDEGREVDLNKAEMDAKKLYEDGEKRWGTNETTFIEIFTMRNRPHLVAVDAAYCRLYHHSLEEAVKKETSRYMKQGLLTLLNCAKGSSKYFAEVIHKSLKGGGTADTTLIRAVVTKAENEMQEIKDEYEKAYKKSLKEAIHLDTSGSYRTFLVSIVDRKPEACCSTY